MVRANLILPAAAALVLSIVTTAQAAPVRQTITPYAGKSIVQKVDGCHRSYRFHYVPEIDERAEHKHRGNRCVPVILEGGGGYDDDYIQHCHRNGQRHRHSGFGRTTHSHYGSRCRIDVWEQYDGSGSGRNCIKIGALQFCN